MRTFYYRSPGVVEGTQDREPVLKPVEKIGVEAEITRERVFDYERAKTPESVAVHLAAVPPNPIINYQPAGTSLKSVISQEKSAFSPVLSTLFNHVNKFITGFSFPKVGPVKTQGRIAVHSPSFGIPLKPPTITQIVPPLRAYDLKIENKTVEPLNFLDKFFNWINSVARV